MVVVVGPDGRRWALRRRLTPARARRFLQDYRRAWHRVLAAVTHRMGGPVEHEHHIATSAFVSVPNAMNELGQRSLGNAGGLVVTVALLPVAAALLALFLAVELVLLLVVGVAGLAGHVALRRPWTVEASSPAGGSVWREAEGWAASGRTRRQLADALRAGDIRPD
ncbi:MAG: hypothetical protein JWO68_1950 [Actinomycetia bacterium]|nr:hypothetical protein [Actinomycetes bacterium]